MKHILLTLAILFCATLSFAQELKVKSFTHDVMNREGQIDNNLPNDLNGKPCALLKVMVADKITKCEGGNVGNIVDEGMVKKIYISPTAKYVTLYFQNYFPVKMVFADHVTTTLQSMETYEVALLDQNSGPQPQQKQGNFLVMTVTPANALVTIDDAREALNSDGTLKKYLPNGIHRYSIDAGNAYLPTSGTIDMKGERVSLPITLQSLKAFLTVKTSTLGSKIYVNEDYKGTDSWQGTLSPGTYLVESRKDGFRTASKTVTLSKQQTETITLPALQPIFGSLLVDYEPVDADIYLNNHLLGKTPNVFSNITVGKHSLKISKPGYSDYIGSVTIQENQQSSISGSLTKSNSSSSSLSSISGTVVPITVNGVTFNMIKVDGGTFTMGATSEMKDPRDDEKPTHQVTLPSYYIGETEVTQALWKSVMGTTVRDQRDKANFSWSRGEGDNYPIYCVSWNDCQDFIKKLNIKTGKKFRLPTEAEWEFAARGGNMSRHTHYSGSSNIDEVAWYDGNSGSKTHPVKTKKANELGIYDMSGNVFEWCRDWKGSYSSKTQNNPTGPDIGAYRVCRGGSWGSNARGCRSSNRVYFAPGNRIDNLGLRLVLSELRTER